MTDNNLVLQKHSALVSMRGVLSPWQHCAFDAMLHLAMPYPEQLTYQCQVKWLIDQSGYKLGGIYTVAKFVADIRAISHIGIDIDNCDLLGKAAKAAAAKGVLSGDTIVWSRPALIQSIAADAAAKAATEAGADEVAAAIAAADAAAKVAATAANGWPQVVCTSFNLLAEVSLLENGMLEYSFARTMKRLAFNPWPYAEINLVQQQRLKRAELGLFGICSDFKGSNIPELPYAAFKSLLGVDVDSYRDYTAFRDSCFLPAAQTVGQRLGITIVLEPHYFKRKVVNVKLRLTKCIAGAEVELTLKSLVGMIPDAEEWAGCIAVVEAKVGQGMDLDRVAENIDLVLGYDEPVKSYVRLLSAAINEDFASKKRKRERLEAKKREERERDAARDDRRKKALAKKEATERARRLASIANFSAERRAQIYAFIAAHGGDESVYFEQHELFKSWVLEQAEQAEREAFVDEQARQRAEQDEVTFDMGSFDVSPREGGDNYSTEDVDDIFAEEPPDNSNDVSAPAPPAEWGAILRGEEPESADAPVSLDVEVVDVPEGLFDGVAAPKAEYGESDDAGIDCAAAIKRSAAPAVEAEWIDVSRLGTTQGEVFVVGAAAAPTTAVDEDRPF